MRDEFENKLESKVGKRNRCQRLEMKHGGRILEREER